MTKERLYDILDNLGAIDSSEMTCEQFIEKIETTHSLLVLIDNIMTFNDEATIYKILVSLFSEVK